MALVFRNQPSAVVRQGYPVPQETPKTRVKFNKQNLTFILINHNKNPFTFRSLLRRSRIGSAFDMPEGTFLNID